MPTLNTDRLRLREFEERDAESLFELYRLPETSRFESWEPFKSEVEARDLIGYWIVQQRQASRRQFAFAVDLLEQERFIGLCSLDLGFGTETDDPRSGFVGYRYFPQEWRKGYATEALQEVVRWGFEEMNLHRIHSGCVRENHASARVLEKAGMRLEGTTRKSIPVADDWHDYLIFGLLREDFWLPR